MNQSATRCLIAGALAILTWESDAHSGRTDASGCHTCRTNCAKYGLRTGQYHCHGGGGSSTGTRKPKPRSPQPPVRILQPNDLSPSQSLPENSIVRRGRRDESEAPRLQVDVLTVVDGDTFVVRNHEKLYLLTLHGIEAPELEQPGGPLAKETLETRITGRRLSVWPQHSSGGVVLVRAEAEGQDLAQWLLSRGLAWAAPGAAENLVRLQETATDQKAGLWSSTAPEPPWVYRTRRTMEQN